MSWKRTCIFHPKIFRTPFSVLPFYFHQYNLGFFLTALILKAINRQRWQHEIHALLEYLPKCQYSRKQDYVTKSLLLFLLYDL